MVSIHSEEEGFKEGKRGASFSSFGIRVKSSLSARKASKSLGRKNILREKTSGGGNPIL